MITIPLSQTTTVKKKHTPINLPAAYFLKTIINTSSTQLIAKALNKTPL